MLRVVHQPQKGSGAGGAMEQLPEALLRREGEAGAADLMAQVLGVKGLIRSHAQQVELGFLPVAEKEILADGHAQDLTDGGALLHIVGGVAGHPVIVDTQFLQKAEGGILLGEKFSRGAGIVVQRGNFHGSLCFLCQKFLARAVNIPRAHGQNEVAGPGQLTQLVRHLIQRGAVDGTGDIAAQVGGGDAQGILLPGCVDLRQHRHIRQLQLLHEAVEQLGGAGVGVGLEGHHQALIPQLPGGGQQGVELIRVVGIVVVDLGAVENTLALKAASGAGEGGQSLLHGAAGDAQHIGGRGGGQGV